MPWHVTPVENLQKILVEGLIPAIGDRSRKIAEVTPKVHLFSSFSDFQDANWLWDEFEEDQQLALLHVACRPAKAAWTELATAVRPDRIRLLSLDAGELCNEAVLAALVSLDQVSDPLGDLGSFRKTRTEMKASEFGLLVGDRQWQEHEDTTFLVYGAGYWIEQLENGMHMLTEGDRPMITGEGTTLEDLEEVLFYVAASERLQTPEEPAAAPGF